MELRDIATRYPAEIPPSVNGPLDRPAKSPGISGSLQKWRVTSRSPGNVKKSPGIEGI